MAHLTDSAKMLKCIIQYCIHVYFIHVTLVLNMSHFVMKDIQSTLFDSIKDVWIYKIYKRRIAPVKVCEGRVDVRSAAILDKFA